MDRKLIDIRIPSAVGDTVRLRQPLEAVYMSPNGSRSRISLEPSQDFVVTAVYDGLLDLRMVAKFVHGRAVEHSVLHVPPELVEAA